jgi:hypothetical protein
MIEVTRKISIVFDKDAISNFKEGVLTLEKYETVSKKIILDGVEKTVQDKKLTNYKVVGIEASVIADLIDGVTSQIEIADAPFNTLGQVDAVNGSVNIS